VSLDTLARGALALRGLHEDSERVANCSGQFGGGCECSCCDEAPTDEAQWAALRSACDAWTAAAATTSVDLVETAGMDESLGAWCFDSAPSAQADDEASAATALCRAALLRELLHHAADATLRAAEAAKPQAADAAFAAALDTMALPPLPAAAPPPKRGAKRGAKTLPPLSERTLQWTHALSRDEAAEGLLSEPSMLARVLAAAARCHMRGAVAADVLHAAPTDGVLHRSCEAGRADESLCAHPHINCAVLLGLAALRAAAGHAELTHAVSSELAAFALLAGAVAVPAAVLCGAVGVADWHAYCAGSTGEAAAHSPFDALLDQDQLGACACLLCCVPLSNSWPAADATRLCRAGGRGAGSGGSPRDLQPAAASAAE